LAASGTRIAFFGGSFDPPHVGHVMACAWALSTGEIDRVWVVPCGRHAFSKPLSPLADRARMCKLAFSVFGRNVLVRRIEEEDAEASYTIDTVDRLRVENPGASFRLLVGSDILAEIGLWKDSARLEEMAQLLVVPRARHLPGGAGAVAVPDVSSSEIRRRIRAGKDASGMLPAAVERYVRKKGLYLKP
jgi:nicotinate-nucleotide adenylyltransferase